MTPKRLLINHLANEHHRRFGTPQHEEILRGWQDAPEPLDEQERIAAYLKYS